MIELAIAIAITCMVRDSPDAIDSWLRRKGMTPHVTLYSGRAERQATIWRKGERYATVVIDRGKACIVDMGKGWREMS